MHTYDTDFKPTWLYIKRHKLTGKLYFGKTINDDPVKYSGSGLMWKRHCEKHGWEFIETLWFCLFHDKQTLTEFAIMCSKQWDIVKSKEWKNLIIENGLDGGHIGPKGPQRNPRGPLSEAEKDLRRGPKSAESVLKRSKTFKVTCPSGNVYEGRNLKQFCSEHNLNQGLMAAVCRGTNPHHKGWTGLYT